VEILETPGDRLPPPIESAVYFVVAEALTNAARYATASSVTVSVSHDDGVVEVEVRDDGIGGADPQRGSGLRGLHDRIAALDGRLELASVRWRGHDRDSEPAVRVIVADDSILLREGVVRVLEDAGSTWWRRPATAELMRKVRLHKPDVAIIDIRMPPTYTDEGLQAALAIRGEMPETPACWCSRSTSRTSTRWSCSVEDAAGVGYLLKDRVSDFERFTDAVRRVAEGGSALDPEVVSQMLGAAESRTRSRSSRRASARCSR
jgi:DNA-binding NarL/FixJ family response regulator